MIHPFSPDDHSEREPPDPMPNSAVKPLSADGSVGPPHARVGHRQAFIRKTPSSQRARGFFIERLSSCMIADCHRDDPMQALVPGDDLDQSWRIFYGMVTVIRRRSS